MALLSTSIENGMIKIKHKTKNLEPISFPQNINKDELLNLIFQNKTILKKAAKEMISELYKDELVKVCEKM